jgi:hypothetical protein
MEIMSRLNNRITRKVIALSEVQMKIGRLGTAAGGLLLDQHGQRRPP